MDQFAPKTPQSDAPASPDWIALVGVVVSVVLHVILDADKPCLPFIVGCCLAWTGYVVVRVWRDRSVLGQWGFRTDNLHFAWQLPLLFLIASVAAMAVFGAVAGTLRFPPHAVLLLLLYPIWGFIQQFLALGIVARNLELLGVLRGRPLAIALATASIFSLVHINDWRVMLATFVSELAFVLMFFRVRNVLPLAVVHGWLGAFYYLWVLDVDLWVQTFG